MNTATLILLDRPGRLLKKTRGYLADMEMFISDPVGAVTILLDTLPYADTALILKILPLLGYAGKDRALWPLYHLMMETSADDQICRSAALQLGMAASLSEDPSRLKSELINNLNHPESSVRSCCALALGWEGNRPAVSALMASLQDPRIRHQVVENLSAVDTTDYDPLKEILRSLLADKDPSVRQAVIRLFSRR